MVGTRTQAFYTGQQGQKCSKAPPRSPGAHCPSTTPPSPSHNAGFAFRHRSAQPAGGAGEAEVQAQALGSVSQLLLHGAWCARRALKSRLPALDARIRPWHPSLTPPPPTACPTPAAFSPHRTSSARDASTCAYTVDATIRAGAWGVAGPGRVRDAPQQRKQHRRRPPVIPDHTGGGRTFCMHSTHF
jgi:hypothetical protein